MLVVVLLCCRVQPANVSLKPGVGGNQLQTAMICFPSQSALDQALLKNNQVCSEKHCDCFSLTWAGVDVFFPMSASWPPEIGG